MMEDYISYCDKHDIEVKVSTANIIHIKSYY